MFDVGLAQPDHLVGLGPLAQPAASLACGRVLASPTSLVANKCPRLAPLAITVANARSRSQRATVANARPISDLESRVPRRANARDTQFVDVSVGNVLANARLPHYACP